MKKLIAVGTCESNSKKWHCWDEVELYVADSIEEALFMANKRNSFPAVEIDMTVSMHLLSMPKFPDD